MRRSCVVWSSVGVLSVLPVLSGCSSEPSGHSPEEPAKPVAPIEEGSADLLVPDDGFQVQNIGADIRPGDDIEYCEIGELPGDPSETYHVKSLELGNAAFSHHLVVVAAVPESAADAALRALDVGDRVPCNGANFEWPEEGLAGLLSAQTPYIAREFPDGVGTILHGNQRIVFDYHYVNTSEETVRARSALNVHVVDGASVDHIATAFSFFNFTIDLPPKSSETFTSECHFTEDLMLAGLVRHTHQQGTDFSVSFSGGPNDGEHVWTSHDWKHEPGYDFEEPIVMKAGEGFRFECAFENPSDHRLRYGIRGSDEMCILAGWIWAAGDVKDLSNQNCGVTWIDDDGIGHSATESGGFPPASEKDAQVCLAGLGLIGFPDAHAQGCGGCTCDSCGSVLLKCAGDADCAALLACFRGGCATEAECVQACKSELHDHSSAVGMMQEVQSCLTTRCGDCGLLGG